MLIGDKLLCKEYYYSNLFKFNLFENGKYYTISSIFNEIVLIDDLIWFSLNKKVLF